LEQKAEASRRLTVLPEDALGYLRQVYRNPLESTHVRMKAAAIALEYERPRLAVVAQMSGDDLAERLNRAVERSGTGPKMISAKAQQVEAVAQQVADGQQVVAEEPQPQSSAGQRSFIGR
jgi:hypothetical protein